MREKKADPASLIINKSLDGLWQIHLTPLHPILKYCVFFLRIQKKKSQKGCFKTGDQMDCLVLHQICALNMF